METFIFFDQELFLILNAIHNEVVDLIMWWVSNKYVWIPFYLLIIAIIIRDNKKQSLFQLLCLILLIVFVDQATSSVMKPLFSRLRPCHDAAIGHLVHLVGSCGGRYGFVSGHAANSFAVATFVFLALRIRKWWWIFIWASIIAYSRVYLGVHYPGDILLGSAIGIGAGYLAFKAYQKAPIKY